MNILYLSCHSILEFDETKLLTELGHKVLSLGAYQNPSNPQDIKRPGYRGFYDDSLQAIAIQCSKDDIHPKLIEWCDAVVVMHRHDWIIKNLEKLSGKLIFWRSIGQSQPQIEGELALLKAKGIKLIRYSPKESTIQGYAGQDFLIRFYKDKDEFSNWNGKTNKVITFAQSMRSRGDFCGFNIFDHVTSSLPRALYGPNNEDSGIDGGLLSYEDLKQELRNNRVYFYTGTYPASYTLNFMEAMMTGIPIVAIGNNLANLNYYRMDTYEIEDIIKNGHNGYISNNITELRDYVNLLLNNHDLAKKIGNEGRKTAIELFDKQKIKKEWGEILPA